MRTQLIARMGIWLIAGLVVAGLLLAPLGVALADEPVQAPAVTSEPQDVELVPPPPTLGGPGASTNGFAWGG